MGSVKEGVPVNDQLNNKKFVIRKKAGASAPSSASGSQPEEEQKPAATSEAQGAGGKKKMVFKMKSGQPGGAPNQAKPASLAAGGLKKRPARDPDKPPIRLGAKDLSGSKPQAATPKPEPKPEPSPEPPKDEAFKFYCVYCGQKLSGPKSAVGRKITCPSCKNKIHIPDLKPIA
jgi:DNA-directed RNA polymerase subunit RPC12/RpoP